MNTEPLPQPTSSSSLTAELAKDDLFRVLSLDGGGAKGFYTLGVLKEIEGFLGCPLYKRFDLVFGTSTGAIIAALVALGFEVDQIHDLYRRYVPEIMKLKTASDKSKALEKTAAEVFGEGKKRHDTLSND
jgi:patatin-like phospholipase/acyl hydrolase